MSKGSKVACYTLYGMSAFVIAVALLMLFHDPKKNIESAIEMLFGAGFAISVARQAQKSQGEWQKEASLFKRPRRNTAERQTDRIPVER